LSEILEHNEEAAPGLPAELPAGEALRWQESPDAGRLARSTFRVPLLGIYFVVIILLQQVLIARGDEASLAGVAGYAVLAVVVLGLLSLYAKLVARSTVYTITSDRVIMRCGVALPVSFNLPFALIDSADVRRYADGSGDIVLTPVRGHRVSWVLLWPHVKTFRLLRVRPVLRALPDVESAAATLAAALEVHAGRPPAPKPEPSPQRDETAGGEGRRRFAAYPTVPLAAAASLVVISLVLVTAFKHDEPGDRLEPIDAVATLELRFEDLDNGSVAVYNAAEGTLIDTVEPGEHGFLRASLRTLATARRAMDAGPEVPFRLTQAVDGRLLLIDPVTQREIDLHAFGKTNAEAFSRLFALDSGGSPAGDSGNPANAIAQTNQEK